MRSLRLAAVVSVAVLSSISAWAQAGGAHVNVPPAGINARFPETTPLNSADKEGKVTFRSQTILVQVPVIVADKSGEHLHGLTKDDFHILENGKEQKIASFEETVAARTKLPLARPKPGEYVNLTLSDNEPRVITVIAIDTVNTPFLDQESGRRALVKYLGSVLDPSQVLVLMVMSSHGLRTISGLTADPTQLVEALKKVSGELTTTDKFGPDAQAEAYSGNIADLPGIPSHVTGGNLGEAVEAFIEREDAIEAAFQQQNAIEMTMNDFLALAWSLSGLPGRKSVIWVTGGFPFAISSPDVVPGGYLSAAYERAMESLSNANISIYPVDVRGLTNPAVVEAGASRSHSSRDLQRQIGNRSWLQTSSRETLVQFAEMTGGKAFFNSNDLSGSFKRAAEDGSSYYLLGYYLDTGNTRSGWRDLKVKVEKKNAMVRARNGFFVTKATVQMDTTRESDLSFALTTPIDGTGVPVAVSWSNLTAEGSKKKAGFVVHTAANGLTFASGQESNLNFDFVAMAYTEKGKTAGQVSFQYAKPVPETQLASIKENGVYFQNALELDPGKYIVRFVVRDNNTGRVGSVTAPLRIE